MCQLYTSLIVIYIFEVALASFPIDLFMIGVESYFKQLFHYMIKI